MRVTFLGTGTSRGIPVIGCDCRVCRSDNPKNRRLRSSVLIEGEASVVIDTSVDFRTQMLDQDVRSLDAVVLTHAHADHILGLDDVYPFCIWGGKPLPVYADAYTLEQIKRVFQYLFEEDRYPGTAQLELRAIDGPFEVNGMCFEPIQVLHGNLPVLGFRLGEFAYLTDVSRIPGESQAKLQGLRYLVLDGLRFRSHPTHFSIPEAVETATDLGASQTYLVHMSHDVEHDETNADLPASVQLAYDGLVLEID